jgi:hypothetical protein
MKCVAGYFNGQVLQNIQRISPKDPPTLSKLPQVCFFIYLFNSVNKIK